MRRRRKGRFGRGREERERKRKRGQSRNTRDRERGTEREQGSVVSFERLKGIRNWPGDARGSATSPTTTEMTSPDYNAAMTNAREGGVANREGTEAWTEGRETVREGRGGENRGN